MQPEKTNTIYMMGIGGIAMGTLATMLKERGHNVVGSDLDLYPPMSTHLETLGIPVCQGYSEENIDRYSPDLIVIGNVIRRDNPEAQYVLRRGLPHMSMPEAINRFFLSEHESIVVAGTHGKSTTSSLVAWVLADCGMDPSAFIGAFLKQWQRSYRLGRGRYMILEGDEYDTAFFDKGAKFLHYRPHIGILTSIEFDHADIFADFNAVLEAFRQFVGLIPEEGYLIVNADDENCLALSRECKGKVMAYGWSEGAAWRVLDECYNAGEVRFRLFNPLSQKVEEMRTKIPGRHNLGNTVSTIAAASIAGLPINAIQEALLRFGGVKRRQDIVGEHHGTIVMEDFAHHPTAVRETIHALRTFYPDKRLITAFEPRTNSSRRRVFQDAYATAFDEADCICIKQPPGMDAIPEDERLDTEQLVRDIMGRNKEAHYFANADDLLSFMGSCSRPGDLLLCMSNGSFDGVPQRLLRMIQKS